MSKQKLLYIGLGVLLGVYVVPKLPIKFPGA